MWHWRLGAASPTPSHPNPQTLVLLWLPSLPQGNLLPHPLSPWCPACPWALPTSSFVGKKRNSRQRSVSMARAPHSQQSRDTKQSTKWVSWTLWPQHPVILVALSGAQFSDCNPAMVWFLWPSLLQTPWEHWDEFGSNIFQSTTLEVFSYFGSRYSSYLSWKDTLCLVF